MKIGARWIHAELHAEWALQFKFRPQLRLANDLGRALLENGKRFVRLHGRYPSLVAGCYLLLFNNSRTCSIVSGLFCVESDFWLLPRSRKGRLPAYSRTGVVAVAVASGATCVPALAADVATRVSLFFSCERGEMFAAESPARKCRAANWRGVKARSSGKVFGMVFFSE